MVTSRLTKTYHKALRAALPDSPTFWRLHSRIQRKAVDDSLVYKEMYEKLSSALQLNSEAVVFEAGCGKGDWLALISPKVRSAVGVDLEEGMINEAKMRTRGLKNIKIESADLEGRLPFPDGSFDKAASTLVYGYLSNRAGFLNELSRILVPGGSVAIITPKKGVRFVKVLLEEIRRKRSHGSITKNLSKIPTALGTLLFIKLAELKGKTGQWRFLDQDELASDLRSAGFDVLSLEPVYAGQAWLAVAKKSA